MTVKTNNIPGPAAIMQFGYYWFPPLFFSVGIFIMAGDLGSAVTLNLPVIILKYLLPSWSNAEIQRLYFDLRKLGHFVAYAVLFGAYARAWRWHLHMSRRNAILLALLVCLAISVGDESRQALHSSRTGCFRDVALDMTGALTAALAFFPFLGHDHRKN